MKTSRSHRWLIMLFVCLAWAGSSRPAVAQDSSKDIGVVTADELVGRSGASPKLAPNNDRNTKTPGAGRRYRSPQAFAKRTLNPQTEFAAIGVTIRRLPDSDGAKGMDQEGEEAQLEQVSTDAALNIGSRVRIYLEPIARGGFMYVVDREQFADGSYGVPKLIFPTLRTRKGNNQVSLRELVQIPRPPSYFKINPSTTGQKQIAEVLTIVISPTPLELPEPLGEKAMTLSVDLFTRWARWAVPVTRFKVDGGAGQMENAKSLDQVDEEAQLKQTDPLPETVFRGTVKKGSPLVVTVPLRFK